MCYKRCNGKFLSCYSVKRFRISTYNYYTQMNKFITASLLTAAAVTTSAVMTVPQPAQAQGVTFVCAMPMSGPFQGMPTTYAQTPRGAVPVVRWYSEYFSGSGYTPLRRCQEVTGRFQSLHSQGQLSFITTGYVNGLPVVCASNSGGCNNNNLLFTLKSGEDAAAAVQKLFDLRATAGASGPLFESSAEDEGGIEINFTNFLSNAAVDSNAPMGGESNPSMPSNSAQPSQPSAPSGGGFF